MLSLPAIALSDEHYRYEGVFRPHVFSRKAGEALHPERDSVDTYMRIRDGQGIHLQQPVSAEPDLSRRWAHQKGVDSVL